MVYIYDDIQSLDLDTALSNISEQRREKALKIKHEQGRRECVAAYLLLKYALREEYHICENPIFAEQEGGKPYIANHEEVHFNLSHCREAVACIVSDKEVGIDVERIRPYDDRLAQYVFNDDEYARVKASCKPALEFTKLWTRKEAFLKLMGEGIHDNLKTVLIGARANLKTVVNESKNYVYTIATTQPTSLPSQPLEIYEHVVPCLE